MTKARSNATANAAKGDLTVGNGTNLSGVLAVGSNGDTIVADASTATGLRYTAGTVQGNPVLNSAFQVFQRGTSTAVTAPAYVADRWQAARDANASGITYSRQATGDTTNLPFIQYCLRVQRDSGTTGTGTSYVVQSMESINSIPFAGKTITYSFYARRGANYSAGSNLLGVIVAQGTGTDQNLLTAGYTGGTNLISSTATLTTTWQRFTYTASVASASTEIGLMFQFTPTGTAGAADFYEVTGVQIDIGSVALPFRTYAGTIQGELAACQRYYYRNGADTVYQTFGNGSGASTTIGTYYIQHPVPMRVAPTSIDYSTLSNFDTVTVAATASSVVINSNQNGKNGTYVQVTNSSAVLTQYRPYFLIANNSSSAYLGFGAEL